MAEKIDGIDSELFRGPQVWYLADGKEIHGQFMGESKGVIHVAPPQNESNAEDLKNLKPKDKPIHGNILIKKEDLSREALILYEEMLTARKMRADYLLLNPTKSTPPQLQQPPAGYADIKLDKLVRPEIPLLEQSRYRDREDESLSESFTMFFLWWERGSNLPISRGNNPSDKMKYISNEMSRVLKKTHGSRYTKTLDKNFEEYFRRHFKDKAAFAYQEVYDLRPHSLAAHATGSNATVLSLSIYKGDKFVSHYHVSVLSASKDGSITIGTWGQVFSGRIRLYQDPDSSVEFFSTNSPNPGLEIVLDKNNKLPSWFLKDNLRFIMPKSSNAKLRVLTPYLKT